MQRVNEIHDKQFEASHVGAWPSFRFSWQQNVVQTGQRIWTHATVIPAMTLVQ